MGLNFQFAFEPDNGLCVYRLSGDVTVDGLLESYAAARRHSGWSETYDFLTVMDNVRLGDMSPAAMDELLERMATRDVAPPSHPRRSALVCNDPLSQALLTYWKHSARRRDLVEEGFFQFEDEAREWLRAARARDAAGRRNTG